MLYSDKVIERMESLRTDLAALRQLPGSKKLEAGLNTLEADLDRFLEACEERLRERSEKLQNAQDAFDLQHRQLLGISEEIGVLARKRPEQPLGSFKAQQVNLVLQPLKDEMEASLGMTLCLADENGAHSYSDVSLLVRNYLDLSAVYALRRYNLRYYDKAR